MRSVLFLLIRFCCFFFFFNALIDHPDTWGKCLFSVSSASGVCSAFIRWSLLDSLYAPLFASKAIGKGCMGTGDGKLRVCVCGTVIIGEQRSFRSFSIFSLHSVLVFMLPCVVQKSQDLLLYDFCFFFFGKKKKEEEEKIFLVVCQGSPLFFSGFYDGYNSGEETYLVCVYLDVLYSTCSSKREKKHQ